MSELTTEMVRIGHVTSAESDARFGRWISRVRAEAWQEGLDYARSVAQESADHHRALFEKNTGLEYRKITNREIQPAFDAIDACPSPLTYSSYNDHIHYVTASSIVDALTVFPGLVTDEGTWEADEDPNPHLERTRESFQPEDEK